MFRMFRRGGKRKVDSIARGISSRPFRDLQHDGTRSYGSPNPEAEGSCGAPAPSTACTAYTDKAAQRCCSPTAVALHLGSRRWGRFWRETLDIQGHCSRNHNRNPAGGRIGRS